LKTIIYYYTLTGQCEKNAVEMAVQLDCDCERIIEKKKRLSRGFLRFLNGGSAIQKEIAKIEPVSNDPDKFDRIIVVAPFWAASPVPAIRGFTKLYQEQLKGKKLGLALSNLGTDPKEAFRKYEELFPEHLVTMSFTKAKGEWTDPKMSEKIKNYIVDLDKKN
jgi:menaquinone-dependent protoporphyrinogen IX oxidase